jgi:protein phosphatase
MFDIIGDIHGCLYELYQLLEKLDYEWDNKTCLYKPSEGRKAISVGDIVSRGRSSATTYGFVKNMIEAGYMLAVCGNHDDKIKRWAKGNNVSLMHGDDKTAEDFERQGIPKESIYKFLKSLPFYLSLDDKKLVIVHAAWRESLINRSNFHKKCRSWCLYGPTTGEVDEHGLPVRIDWACQRTLRDDSPIIVYGHQPHASVKIVNKTYGIDTGCVFGGHLTALRYPEMELIQVKAHEVYCEHPKGLGTPNVEEGPKR